MTFSLKLNASLPLQMLSGPVAPSAGLINEGISSAMSSKAETSRELLPLQSENSTVEKNHGRGMVLHTTEDHESTLHLCTDLGVGKNVPMRAFSVESWLMYQKSKPKFKTFYRGIPLAQHREQCVFIFSKAWNLTKYCTRDGEESEL